MPRVHRLLTAAAVATCAASSGCIPRLYSADGPAGPWSWTAPENTWPLASPPEGTVGEGYDEGQIVPDFRLVDQNDDEVSLWQFYGNVVLLDISTLWCRPCQDLATHTEDTWSTYRDQGFVYVTVIAEDLEGNPPGAADLDTWVDGFGITSPVVADPEEVTASALDNGTFPAVIVIGRDLVVADRLGTTDEEVRAGIEAEL